MKTSKTTQPTHSQEECGVWLDPVQLKGKAKQKRRVRPISKLLNPLTKGEGYSLAVALNFTQTKMEMPKNKQSIISTYFTPHQRVINKMSSSGLQSFNPVQLSVSSNASEAKQDSSLQNPDESGVAFEEERKIFTRIDPPFLRETEEEMTEDSNPPPNKKKVVVKSLLLDDSESLPQAWSLDPLFNSNRYSESQFYRTDDKISAPAYTNESEITFFDSLQSEEAFVNVMDVNGRTSTQKTISTSPILEEDDDDKENKSKPSKNTSSLLESNYNLSKTKTILHQNQSSNGAGTDEWIDSRRTKTGSLPLDKYLGGREPDENTLSNLFTQDSEGFRVISHRGPQTRSPLKDRSHLVVRTYKSFEVEKEDDEEDEMLFTQDSQGNMVIKH